MKENIISKSIVKALNRYLVNGDVKAEELDQFKHDVNMAYNIIKMYAEHYHVDE